MENELKETFTFGFSGWREMEKGLALADPAETHPFVSLRRACHVGCGKCGFPADYPLHQKAA